MPGLRRGVFFFIALYFLVRFVGIPLINLIANIVKLARLKKQVAKFGKEIIPIEREANIKISFILIYAIFAILLIVIGIIVLIAVIVFLYLLVAGADESRRHKEPMSKISEEQENNSISCYE